MRILHAGCEFPFGELGWWLALHLRQHLRHPHLVRDTGEVIRRLHGVRLEQGDLLLFADVDDFYMSGGFGDLADAAAFYESDAVMASAVSRSVLFLLDHQLVDLQQQAGCVRKVVKGSGMGMNFSGELSDLAFYHERERWLLRNLQRFVLKLYLSFKDDLLFVLGRSSETGRLSKVVGRRMPEVQFQDLKAASLSCRPGLLGPVSALGLPFVQDPVQAFLQALEPRCVSLAPLRPPRGGTQGLASCLIATLGA